MALHVNAKAKWKPVKFDKFKTSNIDFDGLVSFEELTDYEIVGKEIKFKEAGDKGKQKGPIRSDEPNKSRKSDKKKKNSNKQTPEPRQKQAHSETTSNTAIDGCSKPTGKLSQKKKKQKPRNKTKKTVDTSKHSDNQSNGDKGGELENTEIKSNKSKATAREKLSEKIKKRKQKKKNKLNDLKIEDIEIEGLKNTNVNGSTSAVETETIKQKPSKKSRKRKGSEITASSPSKKKKINDLQLTKQPIVPDDTSLKGMDAWKELFVPPEVLWALREQGFKTPTPIQAQILPSAIRDQLDVVGAAETGSGKTLAFGIPLIHFIMEEKKREKEKLENQSRNEDSGNETIDMDSDDDDDDDDDNDDNDKTVDDDGDKIDEENTSASVDDDDDDDDDDESGDEDTGVNDIEQLNDDDDDDNSDEGDEELMTEDSSKPGQSTEDGGSSSEEEVEDLPDDQFGCVRVIKDVDMSWMMGGVTSVTTTTPPADKPRRTYPRGLILAPTRELAIQVKNHLIAAAKYTGVKVAAIVGGLSMDKQRRILRRCPDILVATPGRLWELIMEGPEYLSEVEKTRYMVVDEADRMIEKGHFDELAKLLERMKKTGNSQHRHTYVFSATLTLIHSAPQRVMLKKKKKLDEKQKLMYLMRKMGLQSKPKVVDLTRRVGTVETLTEAKINCSKEEKDIYLYYFLKHYPGRTLVFTNSKDCIRRLVSIFTLLQCEPLPLHADMHQRQRLKNLDRFTANPNGLLLASDVAARGLDIPNVQHVIHYQVPHAVENYVHRSGRTARASREGLSVVIVSPDDLKNYRKIINTLNKNEELPVFPVEPENLGEVRRRVNIVREIETQEYRFNKKKRKNDWFIKAAEEVGVEIEEDILLEDVGDEVEQTKQRQYMKRMRLDLARMLKQPLVSRSAYSKYPTKSGKLVTIPEKDTSSDALESVKKVRRAAMATEPVTEGTEKKGELTRSQRRRLQRREKHKQLAEAQSQGDQV